MWSRLRKLGDNGAAAVEFALLLPVFVIIVFAVFSGGVLFSDQLALTQAVREAARYGATYPYDAANRQPFFDKVREVAGDNDFGQLSSSSPAYCVAYQDAKSSPTTTYTMETTSVTAVAGSTCAGVNPADLPSHTHVLVRGTKPAELNLIVVRWSIDLKATSVARWEDPS